MLLAALPFVRYVQLLAGTAKPLFQDSQVRVFFGTAAVVVLVMAFGNGIFLTPPSEESFRKALFNVVSILSGTGYASADYMTWGGFPVAVFFFHWPDRWMCGINVVFDQDIPLSATVFVDQSAGSAHTFTPWIIFAPLWRAFGGGRCFVVSNGVFCAVRGFLGGNFIFACTNRVRFCHVDFRGICSSWQILAQDWDRSSDLRVILAHLATVRNGY